MNSLLLVHLGESVPLYIKDCVHQLRLWNPIGELDIFIILDPYHKDNPFWASMKALYGVRLVYTDTLVARETHQQFLKHFCGDTQFRNGYWRHVKERFFFMEEVMLQFGLTNVVAMEYDILVYYKLAELYPRLASYCGSRLAMVMDNETRGHPGFLFMSGPGTIGLFNKFIMAMIKTPYEDMQLLSAYCETYRENVCFLPLITPARNASIPKRRSLCGETSESTDYLSEGFLELGVLFDSLVVGQAVGGIDPRNTNGIKTDGYENEEALYSIGEMPFEWKKDGLWRPMLDSKVLVTIHMHSKALYPFLSDRMDAPSADYNVETLYKSLEQN